MSETARPRVVLVDDHRLFRSGVRAELGEAVDLVGEAETVAEAIALVRRTQPDVVLLDVHMPDGGGQAVLAGVGTDAPSTRFLALSVSDAAEDVIGVIRASLYDAYAVPPYENPVTWLIRSRQLTSAPLVGPDDRGGVLEVPVVDRRAARGAGLLQGAQMGG